MGLLIQLGMDVVVYYATGRESQSYASLGMTSLLQESKVIEVGLFAAAAINCREI